MHRIKIEIDDLYITSGKTEFITPQSTRKIPNS